MEPDPIRKTLGWVSYIIYSLGHWICTSQIPELFSIPNAIHAFSNSNLQV